MQKKALLALVLAMMMTLSSCALIQKDMEVDRATEIVRVGDTVYTKGEIQDQVNYELSYMAYYYTMFGMNYDVTSAANIAEAQDSVINSLVQQAVLDAKGVELGLDQLTEEEQAKVKEAADTEWESDRETVRESYFADTELEGEELEAAIDAQIADLGLTYEDVLESATNSTVRQKVRAYVTDPVTVSDEELQAELDERIANAQNTYESSLSSYGISVNNGSTVYYRPAGYRMVKQILIEFNEEDSAAISAWQTSLNTANTLLTQEQNALMAMGATDIETLQSQVTVTLDDATGDVANVDTAFADDADETVTAAITELVKAQTQVDFFTAKVEEATRAAFANIDEEADEVLAQLAEGTDWNELAAEHNDDPGMKEGAATAETGYAVCENFSNFDPAFTAAAMAIPKVGLWSEKTEGSYGYYIILYASDVEEGPLTLDEVRDTLTKAVLTNKQNDAYTAQLEAWVEEAKPQINRDALNN